MTTLRLYFQGERAGPLLKRAVTRQGDQVRSAARETAREAAAEVVKRGRADIASAPGNWGPRWPAGLHATVSEGGGNIRIAIFHDIPYYNVFERGALIRGKPLLWIPLSFATDVTRGQWSPHGPTAIRARDYPGRLFRVDRKNGKAPLLMTKPIGGPAQAKYFGKESVTIPKKFHVRQIAQQVARSMKDMYRQNLKDEKARGG